MRIGHGEHEAIIWLKPPLSQPSEPRQGSHLTARSCSQSSVRNILCVIAEDSGVCVLLPVSGSPVILALFGHHFDAH